MISCGALGEERLRRGRAAMRLGTGGGYSKNTAGFGGRLCFSHCRPIAGRCRHRAGASRNFRAWPVRRGSLIGIWDISRRRPSPTTGHTGPYDGGSTRLSRCRRQNPGRGIEDGCTRADLPGAARYGTCRVRTRMATAPESVKKSHISGSELTAAKRSSTAFSYRCYSPRTKAFLTLGDLGRDKRKLSGVRTCAT